MKLGELLMQRAELMKRIGQVEARLGESVLVQEGDEPPNDPAELLGELNGLFDQLGDIVSAVNVANNTATLDDGMPVGEALLRRNILSKRIKSLQGVITNANVNSRSRYSQSEIKMVRMVDVVALQKQADFLSKQHRELDVELQKKNWEIELS